MRKFLVLWMLVLVALVPLHATVVAQDDDRFTPEQQALIDTLTVAFENVAAQEAVQYGQIQTLTQAISAPDDMEGVALTTELIQVIDNIAVFEAGDTFANPSQISQVLEQTMTMSGVGIPESNVLQTFEIIYIDGVYYARIEQQAPEDTVGLPQGWFNWSEDPYAIPGVETFNVEQLFNLSAIIPNQEVALVAYDDIYLVDAYETDGESFQVIEVVWNVEALYTNELFGLNDVFNLEALGIPGDEFLDVFIDGSTLTYTATINTTTGMPVGLVTALDSNIELPASMFGSRLILDQTVVNELTFIELTEVPEITVPELAE